MKNLKYSQSSQHIPLKKRKMVQEYFILAITYIYWTIISHSIYWTAFLCWIWASSGFGQIWILISCTIPMYVICLLATAVYCQIGFIFVKIGPNFNFACAVILFIWGKHSYLNQNRNTKIEAKLLTHTFLGHFQTLERQFVKFTSGKK